MSRHRGTPKRWLRLPQVTALPGWDEMTDFDRGAALRHAYRATPPRRGSKAASWTKDAKKLFPCIYRDHPALAALSPKEASRHAMIVTGGNHKARARIGDTEYSRLIGMVAKVQG